MSQLFVNARIITNKTGDYPMSISNLVLLVKTALEAIPRKEFGVEHIEVLGMDVNDLGTVKPEVLPQLYEKLKPIVLQLNQDSILTRDHNALAASIILASFMGALAKYLETGSTRELLSQAHVMDIVSNLDPEVDNAGDNDHSEDQA